jgi:HK97 family phage portal protein
MNILDRLLPWRKNAPRGFGLEIPGRWINIVPGEHGFLSGFQSDLKFPLAEDTVIRFQAVFACISLISQDISKLRPRLMQLQRSGIYKEVQNPAYSPVLRKPNSYQTRIQFIQSWMISKLLRGKAYVYKERDARGVVIAMHVLHPDRCWPLIAEDGSVFWRLSSDRLAEITSSIVVPASELIFDPMITLFHPLLGDTPILAAGIPALQGLKIQSNSLKFFDNESRPSGILSTVQSITDDEAKRLRDQWQKIYAGNKRGGIAVIGDDLKYTAIGISATDAQLIEQLKWSGEMVCSVYHVPAYMVGMAPPPPNSNVEALTQQYYGQCLQWLIESFEVCMDEGLSLATGYCTKLDLNALLRMDTATRYKAHKDGISAGWLAPNEARACEHLEPVAGGDTPYLQVQNYSLAALAERDAEGPPAKLQPSAPPAKAADDAPQPGDPGYVEEDAESKQLEFLVDLIGKDAASDYMTGVVREKLSAIRNVEREAA